MGIKQQLFVHELEFHGQRDLVTLPCHEHRTDNRDCLLGADVLIDAVEGQGPFETKVGGGLRGEKFQQQYLVCGIVCFERVKIYLKQEIAALEVDLDEKRLGIKRMVNFLLLDKKRHFVVGLVGLRTGSQGHCTEKKEKKWLHKWN